MAWYRTASGSERVKEALNIRGIRNTRSWLELAPLSRSLPLAVL